MSDDLLGKEYISNWELNAKQHFDDGDYEWICDIIQEYFPDGSCERILEIGCGAGYSTLVFLLRDYRVVSVDINEEAIAHTDTLIQSHDYTSKIKTTNDVSDCDEDALLWKKDILHDLGHIKEWIERQEVQNQINLIVLCNPGGNMSKVLTERECDLLKCGGFDFDEILSFYQNGCIDLLHKWSMIYASCALSHATNIPLLIVERDTNIHFENTLKQLKSDVQMAMANLKVRAINQAPLGGTYLVNMSDETCQQYWGAALFTPAD